jgi:hypothetical protein
MVEPRSPLRTADFTDRTGGGRRQKWLYLIPVDAKPFDYEAEAELFRLEAENSIVSLPDTYDLTALQTRSDLQSKNCRHSCSWGPTSKSRRSGSRAMKCAACMTAPNFRLRGVLRCSSGGHAYTT